MQTSGKGFHFSVINIIPKIQLFYCKNDFIYSTLHLHTTEWLMVLLVQDYLRHSMRVSAGEQIWGFWTNTTYQVVSTLITLEWLQQLGVPVRGCRNIGKLNTIK